MNISINHIMTCARGPGVEGCHGGWEHEAWNFLSQNGAVTGGDYGTFEVNEDLETILHYLPTSKYIIAKLSFQCFRDANRFQ